MLGEFFAYASNFTGGVHVAVGDVDGTGGPTSSPAPAPAAGRTCASSAMPRASRHPTMPGRYAYDPNFSGGVFVAAGDVTGDGRAEIVTGPGVGGGPHVRVFGQSLQIVSEFFAYHPNFTGGVRVGLMNLMGDAHLELITAAGPGGGPHVRIWPIPSITEAGRLLRLGRPNESGGVFVAGNRVPAGPRSSRSSPRRKSTSGPRFPDPYRPQTGRWGRTRHSSITWPKNSTTKRWKISDRSTMPWTTSPVRCACRSGKVIWSAATRRRLRILD